MTDPPMPDRTRIIMLTGGFIDWNQPAADLSRFVSVLGGEHPAAAVLRGQLIGIRVARAGGTVSVYRPGTITRLDDHAWVQTGRGHLAIDRIVVGGEEFDGAGYLASAGLAAGDAFDLARAWTDQNTNKELSNAA